MKVKLIENKVSVIREYSGIKIYINELLHLYLTNEIVSIQSWRGDGSYSIEYTYKTTNILTEYDKQEIWEDVLKQLDKII